MGEKAANTKENLLKTLRKPEELLIKTTLKKITRKSGSLEAKNKAMSGDSTLLDYNDIIALFFCLLKMQKPVKICLKRLNKHRLPWMEKQKQRHAHK